MVMGLVSGLLFANHSHPESFWWCTPCSAKMDVREDSERWLDMWCLLLTFAELFLLVVAYYFHVPYQDLCRETAHANGYYGAWPGWAVLVSVLPLTEQQKFTIEYCFR